MTRWMLPLLLMACHREVPAGGDLLDTGWFESEQVSACTARVDQVSPADGATGISWRAEPVVSVFAPSDAYTVRLTTAGGAQVSTAVVPDQTGLNLAVVPDEPLRPSTAYVLEVTDCAGTTATTFTTSSLGTPVHGGNASLQGRTYELDLVNARWVEPGGFGSFLAANFNLAVLVGVLFADDQQLKLIGGPGIVTGTDVVQSLDLATWDFPPTSFVESPWFAARADTVRLDIAALPLPVHDFELEGTFTEDGRRFADGVLKGVGDTRFAGAVVGEEDDPSAICGYASALGVPCIPCADGLPLCLKVELRGLVAYEVDGLTLRPVAGP